MHLVLVLQALSWRNDSTSDGMPRWITVYSPLTSIPIPNAIVEKSTLICPLLEKDVTMSAWTAAFVSLWNIAKVLHSVSSSASKDAYKSWHCANVLQYVIILSVASPRSFNSSTNHPNQSSWSPVRIFIWRQSPCRKAIVENSTLICPLRGWKKISYCLPV